MRSAFSLPLAAFVALAAAQIDLSELPGDISLDDITIPSGIELGDILPTALPTEIPTNLPDSIASLIPSGIAALIPSSTDQSTTTPTGTSDGDSLPSLVDQLPRCAIGCLDSAASDIGCAATDFSCLCSKSEALIASVGSCVLDSSKSSCQITDAASAAKVAPKICQRINSNPSAQEIASASSIVAGAIETGAATTTGGTNNDNGSGATHIGVGSGLLGSLLAMALAF